jgi:hypothetical protein
MHGYGGIDQIAPQPAQPRQRRLLVGSGKLAGPGTGRGYGTLLREPRRALHTRIAVPIAMSATIAAPSSTETRKLAAILAADVVGYAPVTGALSSSARGGRRALDHAVLQLDGAATADCAAKVLT